MTIDTKFNIGDWVMFKTKDQDYVVQQISSVEIKIEKELRISYRTRGYLIENENCIAFNPISLFENKT